MADNDLPPDDRAAILQLCAAYCWFVDSGDRDGLRGLFTSDGVFAFGRNEVSGVDALVDYFASSPRGTHVAGPPLVQRTASGASGRSRFVFVPAGGGAPLAGGYEDEYTSSDGEWRIVRRVARLARADTPS